MDSNNRTKNRNRTVSCPICFRRMRSDNLMKHTESKHGKSKVGLMDELQNDQEKYHETVEDGYHIHNLVMSKEISQASLSSKNAEALKLYTQHHHAIDFSKCELRPWQQNALDLLENPTDRDVIWIRGQTGNEGKTWFQTYMQSRCGSQNIALLDMKCRVNDALHLLSNQPLLTMDMFLFNDVRSASIDREPCYHLLEMIKDGRAMSSKYITKAVKFKVPNVVMVFSNVYPDTKKLSRDRWNVYNITEKGLNPVSIKKCVQYLL